MIEINKAIAFSIVAVGAILGLNNRAAFARPEYFYIRASHSGQCLNVLNSGRDNGDNVVQGERCDTPNFQWAIIPVRDFRSRNYDRNYNYRQQQHHRDRYRYQKYRRLER